MNKRLMAVSIGIPVAVAVASCPLNKRDAVAGSASYFAETINNGSSYDTHAAWSGYNAEMMIGDNLGLDCNGDLTYFTTESVLTTAISKERSWPKGSWSYGESFVRKSGGSGSESSRAWTWNG